MDMYINATWTWTCGMDVDMKTQHGMVSSMNTDIQQ
jgi:hypothetical protein